MPNIFNNVLRSSLFNRHDRAQQHPSPSNSASEASITESGIRQNIGDASPSRLQSSRANQSTAILRGHTTTREANLSHLASLTGSDSPQTPRDTQEVISSKNVTREAALAAERAYRTGFVIRHLNTLIKIDLDRLSDYGIKLTAEEMNDLDTRLKQNIDLLNYLKEHGADPLPESTADRVLMKYGYSPNANSA